MNTYTDTQLLDWLIDNIDSLNDETAMTEIAHKEAQRLLDGGASKNASIRGGMCAAIDYLKSLLPASS